MDEKIINLESTHVSVEQAKRLKNLGFMCPVAYHWVYIPSENKYILTISKLENEDGRFDIESLKSCINKEGCDHIIDAPSFDETIQWFRKKGYHMWIEPWWDIRQSKYLWSYHCQHISCMSIPFSSLRKYDDYDECFREGINCLLTELECQFDTCAKDTDSTCDDEDMKS